MTESTTVNAVAANAVPATKKPDTKKPDTWAARMRALPAAFDIDSLAEMIGVTTPCEAFEGYDSGVWSYVYHERLKEGATEEEAEEAARDAEAEQLREVWSAYVAAVVSAAETLLAEAADLEIVEVRPRRKGTRYRVVPKTSWAKSAVALMHLVNGYGMFTFDSVQEFLASGPYTARQAVLSHLGWARSYAAVYGGETAESRVDREMRRHWG